MTPLRITYTQTVKITFPARLFDRKIVRTLENLRENHTHYVIILSNNLVTIKFTKEEEYHE